MTMLTVRMNAELYERFKRAAQSRGVSMNCAAIHAIETALRDGDSLAELLQAMEAAGNAGDEMSVAAQESIRAAFERFRAYQNRGGKIEPHIAHSGGVGNDLARRCLAAGADPAVVAAWPDHTRQRFIDIVDRT